MSEHSQFQPSVRTVTNVLGIVAGLPASVGTKAIPTVVHLNDYT